MPFVFTADYAENEGIASTAAALVGMIGAASVAGRLGWARLGARWGSDPVDATQLRHPRRQLPDLADGGRELPGPRDVHHRDGLGYGGFIAPAPAVAATLFGTVGLGTILGALYTAAASAGWPARRWRAR